MATTIYTAWFVLLVRVGATVHVASARIARCTHRKAIGICRMATAARSEPGENARSPAAVAGNSEPDGASRSLIPS